MSFEFHINGNQTTFFILFVLRSCTFGFADYIFKSNEDNLQVIYSDKDGQKNPYHVTETRSIDYYAGTHTLIDPLKRFKDYRLFYYLAPAEGLTNELYLPAGEKTFKAK